MEQPVISVVMPAYNAADHIGSAVESILDQTFEDFELVVVDDGSTDQTVSVVESYKDDRIRTIRLGGNTGIPSARNRGTEAARGQYVACHDADDRSHPERFERQVAYLDGREEVAAVGTGAVLVDEYGKRIARRHVFTTPSLADLVEVCHFVHASMLFRRSALEAVGGYDEWFATAEDYDLILRLADEFEVRNVDEPLYEVQLHGDSAYASQLKEVWLYDRLAAKKVTDPTEWARLKAIADREGVLAVADHLSRREQETYHRKVGRDLLRYGQPKAAREHVQKAIEFSKTDPLVYLLYLLTFTPARVPKIAASAYRRLVVNPRLKVANVRRGSRKLPVKPR